MYILFHLSHYFLQHNWPWIVLRIGCRRSAKTNSGHRSLMRNGQHLALGWLKGATSCCSKPVDVSKACCGFRFEADPFGDELGTQIMVVRTIHSSTFLWNFKVFMSFMFTITCCVWLLLKNTCIVGMSFAKDVSCCYMLLQEVLGSCKCANLVTRSLLMSQDEII